MEKSVRTYRLLQTDSQIHNRDVGGGDTESHAGELAARYRVFVWMSKYIKSRQTCIDQ